MATIVTSFMDRGETEAALLHTNAYTGSIEAWSWVWNVGSQMYTSPTVFDSSPAPTSTQGTGGVFPGRHGHFVVTGSNVQPGFFGVAAISRLELTDTTPGFPDSLVAVGAVDLVKGGSPSVSGVITSLDYLNDFRHIVFSGAMQVSNDPNLPGVTVMRSGELTNSATGEHVMVTSRGGITFGGPNFFATAGTINGLALGWDGGEVAFTGLSVNAKAFYDEFTITASGRYDLLFAGNDSVTGMLAAQTLAGGAGNDTVTAGADGQRVEGGEGNDRLDAGAFTEVTLAGGLGNDTYAVNGSTEIEEGVDEGVTDLVIATLADDESFTLFEGLENLVLLHSGEGVITGQGNDGANSIAGATTAGAHNSLSGAGGADTLAGGAGHDTLDGGADNDSLVGGAGNDVLYGTQYYDYLSGGAGDDAFHLTLTQLGAISGKPPASRISDSGGVDTLYLYLEVPDGPGPFIPSNESYILDKTIEIVDASGVDSPYGLTVTGNGLANTIIGRGGRDTLLGNAGNDSLVGGDEQDSLVGGAGNDTLDGATGAGAFAEPDLFDGGAGNDLYLVDDSLELAPAIADAGVDTVRTTLTQYTLGGAQENLVLVNAGSTGAGNAAANELTSLAGESTLEGGAGNDTYRVGDDDEVIENGGGTKDLVVLGSAEGDAYALAEGVEQLLLGTDHGMAVEGNDLANLITGSAFGDTLDGGAGKDTLAGGAGNDSYAVALVRPAAAVQVEDKVVEAANGGYDTMVVSLGGAFALTANFTVTLAANVEALDLAPVGDADLNGTGNALHNVLAGGAGRNKLAGLAGNDSLSGLEAADTLLGAAGNDSLRGGTQNDSIDGGAGTDTAFYAGDFSDYVVTRLSNGTYKVVHADGDATEGADTLAGVEFLSFADGQFTIAEAVAAAPAMGGRTAFLREANFEESPGGGEEEGFGPDDSSLVGGAGDDEIFDQEGNDTLIGNAGNDWLGGGIGNDSMVGGAGDDRYEVDALQDTVVEKAGGGYDQVTTTLTVYVLADQVESLVFANPNANTGIGNALANFICGHHGDDSLDGVAGNDAVLGAGGNDTLLGSAGADTLTGGAGDDLLNGGTGSDVARFSGNAGDYVFTDLGGGLVQVSHAGGEGADGQDTVTGVEAFDFADRQRVTLADALDGLGGGGGNDTVGGGGGNDTTPGEGGDDETLTGASGNDSFFGGDGDDSISGGAGDDQIWDQLGDDTLVGGEGRDWLGGGVGDDSMVGGRGDDRYEVDSTGDVIVELPREGFDQVSTTLAAYTLPDNFENLVFANEISHTGTGNAQDNGISGHWGDDLLQGLDGDDGLGGSSGADTLLGGAGNDTLRGDAGNDSIDGGAGTDTAYFIGLRTDFTLTDRGDGTYVIVNTKASSFPMGSDTLSGIEWFDFQTITNIRSHVSLQEMLGGSAPPPPPPPASPDPLLVTGTSDDDQLLGGGVNDSISGGAGNDTLDGARGVDRLSGGAGADHFLVVEPQYADNVDFITDFTSGADKIVLDKEFFGALELGELPADYFAIASSFGANTRILYNAETGLVFYDSNGGAHGGGDQFPLVVLVGAPALAASDFIVGDETFASGGGTTETLPGGGEGNDTTGGGGGNDTTGGGEGNDTTGGGGNDSPDGGDGNDSLMGGAGNDSFNGGEGENSFTGAGGDDTLVGGQSADWLNGGAGNDSMAGGRGSDHYWVDSLQDIVLELPREGGYDLVSTSLASYTLPDNVETLNFTNNIGHVATGNSLNNGIGGGTGNDLLIGLDGNDDMGGYIGADTLVGGNGNDTLNGEYGSDSIDGGAGNDMAKYVGLSTDFTVTSLGGGLYKVAQNAPSGLPLGPDTISGIEWFSFQSPTGSQVYVSLQQMLGGAAPPAPPEPPAPVPLVVTGTDGDDALLGGGSPDTLSGGLGNDTLDGLRGVDHLSGGDGADHFLIVEPQYSSNVDKILDFTPGEDKIILDKGAFEALLLGPLPAGFFGIGSTFGPDTRILYNAANGELWYDSNGGANGGGTQYKLAVLPTGLALTAADFIVGDEVFAVGGGTTSPGPGFDTAAGGGGDTIIGGSAAQVHAGGAGNDSLFGGDGSDTLSGEAGNDTLEGGDKVDRLTGGDGADWFYFNQSLGATYTEVITDFTPGVDKIVLDNTQYGWADSLPMGVMPDALLTFGSFTNEVQRIKYDITTGILSWDGNGTGGGGNYPLAILENKPVITASDFLIIP